MSLYKKLECLKSIGLNGILKKDINAFMLRIKKYLNKKKLNFSDKETGKNTKKYIVFISGIIIYILDKFISNIINSYEISVHKKFSLKQNNISHIQTHYINHDSEIKTEIDSIPNYDVANNFFRYMIRTILEENKYNIIYDNYLISGLPLDITKIILFNSKYITNLIKESTEFKDGKINFDIIDKLELFDSESLKNFVFDFCIENKIPKTKLILNNEKQIDIKNDDIQENIDLDFVLEII